MRSHGRTDAGGVRLAFVFRRLCIFHAFDTESPFQVKLNGKGKLNEQEPQVQAVFDRYGKLERSRSWRINRSGGKTPITVK